MNGRLKLARLLEDFKSGQISNFEYEEELPESSSDPALAEIQDLIWHSYSDTREHSLTGKDKLTQEGIDTFNRCILFIKTDLPYQYPPSSRLFSKIFSTILSKLGLLGRPLKWEYIESPDESFYPFISKEQYLAYAGLTKG